MIRSQSWATVPTQDERYRPLYARALGLRFVNPGGVLCFLFFEGAVALAVLLALAELVSWWAVLVLPAVVAAMVKLNDVVAELVIRTAARVPEQERDRFRRQMEPVVGRARVPSTVQALPGAVPGPVSASWAVGPADRATGSSGRAGGASGRAGGPGGRAAGRSARATGSGDRAVEPGDGATGSGAAALWTTGLDNPVHPTIARGHPEPDPLRPDQTPPDPSR